MESVIQRGTGWWGMGRRGYECVVRVRDSDCCTSSVEPSVVPPRSRCKLVQFPRIQWQTFSGLLFAEEPEEGLGSSDKSEIK